ncbi:uncharacterized protein MKK02DRAFT_40020 [Dioszegia hungarica]|uniref:Uncharacterized protein n=1 Tax=Dioszegia hungarica TaxID=4972 RepID=A0AA38HDJ6_9TREE|nr:uncharacterized protein MKK02DRAFT_40020 [Dioszegia hungarica]KAI9639698.1 hypothetical protein MKK02DRAFT_40020 [Dioszegia hungarica]
MDELYHARLSAHPHEPSEPHQPQPAPVPVQLPNIYVNPFPPPPPPQPRRYPSPPIIRRQIPPPVIPGPAYVSNMMRFGPFTFVKPHPLLWISLFISLVALVLGVPRGSLPTLTGRHKELRAREKIVDEKLNLISHLSHFLPPPLAHLVHPDTTSAGLKGNTWASSQHAGLRFWNGRSHAGVRPGTEGRWWSVEEMGEGASVVRSSSGARGDASEKEVWVLRMGETDDANRPLLSALTHSLLLRDKLQQDLGEARSRTQAALEVSTALSTVSTPSAQLPLALGHRHAEREKQTEVLQEDWERLEVRRKRDKEREGEVEEREKAVGAREKWVVEEMRKMSEKVHSQATELTLEDRITARLKSYQRQLAHLQSGSSPDSAHHGQGGERDS